MAKQLKSDPISPSDLSEYLNSYSDFSFELSVLKMLRENDIQCEHGGHYTDPVTTKSREFDIRATKTLQNFRVRMAIECKNIRDNFPILVSCIPRHEQESHHDFALVENPPRIPMIGAHLQPPRVKIFQAIGDGSFYKAGAPIGKSTAQVGRAVDGSISTNDSELYEKWGQCLSSAHDLVKRIPSDGEDDKKSYFSTVIPFVVVPNDRLWIVTYDENGNKTSEPTQTDRCSCFIDKDYELGTDFITYRMRLSHLEIVTFNGMLQFIETHLKSEEAMAKIFPQIA